MCTCTCYAKDEKGEGHVRRYLYRLPCLRSILNSHGERSATILTFNNPTHVLRRQEEIAYLGLRQLSQAPD